MPERTNSATAETAKIRAGLAEGDLYRFDLSFPVLSLSCLYFLSKETKTLFGFVAGRAYKAIRDKTNLPALFRPIRKT